MKVAEKVFASAILGTAVLSFAAGRVATKPESVALTQAPAVVDEVASQEQPASFSLPLNPAELGMLPFAQTYQIIKSTSADRLTAYVNELEQLPPGPTRNAALIAFFKTLIQANPDLTKQLILQLKKDDRWLPLQAVREAATPRGMEAVAEVLLSFDRIEISGCSYDLLRDSLDEWGKTDPLALKQFLENHRGQDVDGYFEKLVLNWAAFDPEAAHQWMANEIEKRPLIPTRPTEDGGEEIFDSEWRSAVQQMAVAWIQGFFVNDPDRATQYVVEHVDSEAVQYALNWLAGDLFLVSPERARDLILRLPAEQQSKSIGGVARKADPLVKSDASDNMTSPRFVAEWMLKFPSETYAGDIRWVMNSWRMSDPQELFTWMAALPTSTREEMIRHFPGVSSENTQEDFDSVMQVPDPVLRRQLLEQVAGDAGSSEEKKLRGVLEKSQLPADEKARLISLIPKPEYETASAEEDAN